MVPDGLVWVILMKITVLLFRSITPLCIIHSCLYIAGLAPRLAIDGVRIPLELITFPETLFYLLVYLPRSQVLQRSTAEVTTLTRKERQQLFDDFWENVPDIEYLFRTWFRGVSMNEIRKDNVKDWLAWGFWNAPSAFEVPKKELDEFVSAVETKLGRKFEEGRGPHQPLRTTSDHVNIQHRPLCYYGLGVSFMDNVVFSRMWRYGFRHCPISRYFHSFPYRPITVLCEQYSPARDLSYWYRRHTSKTRMPILFIHGIGIGLVTYTEMFRDLVSMSDKDRPGDQVGIIAIEIMPISFRITSKTLQREDMVRQIRQVLQHHGWHKQQFLLAAHSYGTIIATHLLRDPFVSPRIGPVVLIDPITVWFHMGDIPYSFTAKLPESASEVQLHYFACTDMGAAEAVTRRFIWTENVLWKRDLQSKQFGLVLGGRDIIGNPRKCRDYLLTGYADHELHSVSLTEKIELVRARQLEVLYLDDMNHAEVFHFPQERKALVDMIWRYCSKQPSSLRAAESG